MGVLCININMNSSGDVPLREGASSVSNGGSIGGSGAILVLSTPKQIASCLDISNDTLVHSEYASLVTIATL